MVVPAAASGVGSTVTPKASTLPPNGAGGDADEQGTRGGGAEHAGWDTDGSAWVCSGPAAADCGPQFMAGRDSEPGIHLEPSKEGAYDGWFGVCAISRRCVATRGGRSR